MKGKSTLGISALLIDYMGQKEWGGWCCLAVLGVPVVAHVDVPYVGSFWPS
jgi:hypothetical protein